MTLLSNIMQRVANIEHLQIPMAGSSNTIQASVPRDLVSNLVTMQDERPQRSRVGVGSGYMHVSSLVDVCARKEVISSKYREEVHESINGFHRLMWKYGRAAEEHIRESVIASTNGSTVYGDWHCPCGELRHVGMKPVNASCSNCGRNADIYNEHPIRNEEYKIIGSCDLPLMSQGHLVPVEIKSMKRDQWEGLDAPLANHVTQVALYRWLYQQAGWRVHTRCALVYVVKEYKNRSKEFPSPYKEFHVDCESEEVSIMVGAALEEAASIRDALAEDYLPRRICNSSTETRAKQCSMAHLCFNLSE